MKGNQFEIVVSQFFRLSQVYFKISSHKPNFDNSSFILMVFFNYPATSNCLLTNWFDPFSNIIFSQVVKFFAFGIYNVLH